MAMGWVRVSTQRGVIMTGRTSVRYLSISKETEPEPMTMPARNSITGVGPLASVRPTSWRLSRCSDRSSSLPRPPR